MRQTRLYVGFFGLLFAILLAAGWWLFGRDIASDSSIAQAFDASSESVAAGAAASFGERDTASTEAARAAPRLCGQSEGAACVEYRNKKYGFSLFHSDRQKVTEYDEGGGAMTVTFENIDGGRGFQIFIVPYQGDKVAPERFRRDVASGVMKNPINVTVDGVFGTMFESRDSFLGETREIWFIRKGYLFEVTTLTILDEALQGVMQTWQFI